MVVVAWYLCGLNPRRLVCLADLKSAPLDHSGKIPRQTDTHASAPQNAFTASTMTSTTNRTHLHTSSALIFLVCLLHVNSSSARRTAARTTSGTLCLISLVKRIVSESKPLVEDIKLFHGATVLDNNRTTLQRAARTCTFVPAARNGYDHGVYCPSTGGGLVSVGYEPTQTGMSSGS